MTAERVGSDTSLLLLKCGHIFGTMMVIRRKMALKTATIHIRIQPALKKSAEEIFAESGVTASEVVEQFYAQTVKRGKIPIRLSRRRRADILDENINTPEEIRAALDKAEKSIESGSYYTINEVRERMKTKYGAEI